MKQILTGDINYVLQLNARTCNIVAIYVGWFLVANDNALEIDYFSYENSDTHSICLSSAIS